MIIGQLASPRNARFHIMGSVGGVMQRIGRYHATLDGALREALRIGRKRCLSTVEVRNQGVGSRLPVIACGRRVV
jgi:hypothetical protein